MGWWWLVAGAAPAAPVGGRILLETGDRLLAESGDGLLTEDAPAQMLVSDILAPGESLTTGRIILATLGDMIPLTEGLTSELVSGLVKQLADAPSIGDTLGTVVVGSLSPASTARRKARWTEICRLLTLVLYRDLGSQVIGLQDGTAPPPLHALATDDFGNRPAGGDLGPNWTPYTIGGWQGLVIHREGVAVVAAVAPGVTPASGDIGEVFTGITPTPDQFGEVKAFYGAPRTDPIGAGPWLRCADPPTRTYYGLFGYEATEGTGGGAIYRMLDGVYTLLAVTPQNIDWNIGDVVRGEAVGSTLIVYRNGVEILRTTDTAIPSGKVGVGCFVPSSAHQLDLGLTQWRGGSFAGSGAGTVPTTPTTPTLITVQITREKVIRLSDRYWPNVLDQQWLPLVQSWPGTTGPSGLVPFGPGVGVQTADFVLSNQRRVGGQPRFSALFRHGHRNDPELYDIGLARVAYDWLFRGAAGGEQIPIFRGIVDDWEATEHAVRLRANAQETALRPLVREALRGMSPVAAVPGLLITSFDECATPADLGRLIFGGGSAGPMSVLPVGEDGGIALELYSNLVDYGDIAYAPSAGDSTLLRVTLCPVEFPHSTPMVTFVTGGPGSGGTSGFGISSAGKFLYGIDAALTGAEVAGTYTATAGAWYRLEVLIVPMGPSPRQRFRVYDAAGALLETFQITIPEGWSFNYIRLGWAFSGPPTPSRIWYDDLTVKGVFGETDGELGKVRVGYARLTATTTGEFGTVVPAGVTHHTVLNAVPGASPNDATYVETNVPEQVDHYRLTRTTVMPERAVITRVCVRGRATSFHPGGFASAAFRFIDPGGQIYEGAIGPAGLEALHPIVHTAGAEMFLPGPMLDQCRIGMRYVGGGVLRVTELFMAFEYIDG